MKNSKFKLSDLKKMAELLNTKVEETAAVMNMKNGDRMTTTLYVLRTGAFAFLNMSNCKTLEFENDAELNEYIAKKFETFSSDKEMWQSFTGMDDETWEEWNK